MILLLIAWLAWLLIGVVVGAGVHIAAHTRQRMLNALIVGVLGAFVGGVFVDLLTIPAVIDLNLWSIVGALIGALAASLALWIVNRRQITAIAPVDVRLVVDPITPDDTHDNFSLKLGHRRISLAVPLIAIALLPLLSLAALWLRLPSISSVPPAFGTVASYSNAYGQLDYLVYQPSNTPSESGLPVVVLLHGCTQDPPTLEASSAMRTIADANSFILVYPQQNFIASPHRCWNWYDQRNQQRDSDEPSLIAGIVGQVQQDYSTDPRRVYVGGLSSGGAMTSILGSCYPDVFAAAAVLSGMAYESSTSVFQAIAAPLQGNQVPPDIAGRDAYQCAGEPDRLMPVFVLHGAADTVVIPRNGDDTIEQFAQMNDHIDDGADNDSITAQPTSTVTEQVPDGHAYTVENYEVDGQLVMQRYSVEGMWHMWSGGTGILPLSDPKSPNASQLIWDFFQRHTLN
ncbi:MAG: PHB depolymerase family esterase [Chloroflexota bacterium]|nr:PHB depolymerase family esterase [Chloroflexota bacterium]